MPISTNPFPNDSDRAAIWTMLVARDIAAFVAADWSIVASDFVDAGFFGTHAHKSQNPDDWTLAFPSLEHYRSEWLRQAAESQKIEFAEPLEEGIHRATNLTQIDISGNIAIAHKKFDGSIKLSNGDVDILNWQTLYFCKKVDATWKISGFVGYMPYK